MRWFARTEQLLGPERLKRLTAARVAVFGLGGVGSYAVEALARAGVGSLRLVDYDSTNPTNINRQLFAVHSSLGQPKVALAAARVLDINPVCWVDPRQVFINEETVPDLLEPDVDVVVDAIDSLHSKVLLLEACIRRGLPVISSMGAGGRMDGAQVHCGDLDETRVCPLARVLRQRLHRRGIRTGIRCVYSTEPARNTLPHEPGDAGEHHGAGRPRTPIGTISYLPALFGLRVAQEVLDLLLIAADDAAGSPPGPPERPGCS